MPFGDLNWDKETRRLFFIPPDAEATIDLFWSRVHPEDREPTRIAVEKAIQNGSLYVIEHRAVNPDTGEIRWIRSIGRAWYASDGTPVQFNGVNYDITDRKLAEQALKDSEALFRLVVENSWDGIHQLDLRAGQYVFQSPSQERLTGFTSDELMLSAEEASKRVHPDDREKVEEYLKRIVSGEHADKPVEYRWRVKSGEYRWFGDSRRAIFDENGKSVSLVGVSRDITETKKYQKALERSTQELERKVAERAKLAELRTKQLQSLAVELIEAEERERRRISRLLHEDLQQVIAAAGYQLQNAMDSKDPRPLLAVVEKLMKESMAKSRRLSHELSPAVLTPEF